MRKVRDRPLKPAIEVAAADPLNFRGILTPEGRVSPTSRELVLVRLGQSRPEGSFDLDRFAAAVLAALGE